MNIDSSQNKIIVISKEYDSTKYNALNILVCDEHTQNLKAFVLNKIEELLRDSSDPKEYNRLLENIFTSDFIAKENDENLKKHIKIFLSILSIKHLDNLAIKMSDIKFAQFLNFRNTWNSTTHSTKDLVAIYNTMYKDIPSFADYIKKCLHTINENNKPNNLFYLNDSLLQKKVQESCDRISKFHKTKSGDSGCYIATMVYGDYNHPQVLILRNFRDENLSKTVLGKLFINLYYKYSPILVRKLHNKKTANFIIRKFLNQFIYLIK